MFPLCLTILSIVDKEATFSFMRETSQKTVRWFFVMKQAKKFLNALLQLVV